MTETPMGGPSDQGNWIRSSEVARAIVAVNRYVEARKAGSFPEAAIQYLMGAEGSDAELARRLKVIGAAVPKRNQASPPVATPDAGTKDPVARSPEEIAAAIAKPLW